MMKACHSFVHFLLVHFPLIFTNVIFNISFGLFYQPKFWWEVALFTTANKGIKRGEKTKSQVKVQTRKQKLVRGMRQRNLPTVSVASCYYCLPSFSQLRGPMVNLRNWRKFTRSAAVKAATIIAEGLIWFGFLSSSLSFSNSHFVGGWCG